MVHTLNKQTTRSRIRQKALPVLHKPTRPRIIRMRLGKVSHYPTLRRDMLQQHDRLTFLAHMFFFFV